MSEGRLRRHRNPPAHGPDQCRDRPQKMLSRLTAHKRISTGVEIGQRLGFTAIDPRIEAIQHDDWKANPR